MRYRAARSLSRAQRGIPWLQLPANGLRLPRSGPADEPTNDEPPHSFSAADLLTRLSGPVS